MKGGRCDYFKEEMLGGSSHILMWELTDDLGRFPSKVEIGWQ